MRRHLVPLSICIALVVLAVALRAGPLDPPVGPIVPTYKTLTEVEPRTAINATNTPGDGTNLYKITQPGSYYLTGNLAGVFSKNGIGIATSGVTIDLNGFDASGVAGSLDGIATLSASLVNITVTNGSIRNWNGDGIDFQTNLSFNTRVADVQADFNTGIGIKVGNDYIVSRCGAHSNGAGGIQAANLGVVTLCQTVSNTGPGLVVGQGSSLSDCFSGFNFNAVDAIRTDGFGTITNCTVDFSNANGITAGAVTTITNCSVDGANVNGIDAGRGSTIVNCSVDFAQNINIVVGNSSTVAGCSVSVGRLGGIKCASQCIIKDNNCASNSNGSSTGVNIEATGSDNRIEGNTCTSAARGIKVDAAGNIIVRNTCSGNTNNFELVAGNVFLAVNAATSGAILGNAGGVAPGSTDPSVNLSY